MDGYGGIISVEVKGGLRKARRMLERCYLFALAESLGGVESLIEHPAIMTHASVPPANRKRLGISDGLIRLSVGVEDVRDLVASWTRPWLESSGIEPAHRRPALGIMDRSHRPLDADRACTKRWQCPA